MDNSYVVAADFYDYVEDYRTRPDVPFFVELAKEANGPVLEFGCGTGRVLIPAARAGVTIVGIDLSQPMLDICERKLLLEPSDVQSRVQLHRADMRESGLSGQFALAMIPFRPFQHLVEVEDQLACLASIHRLLRDDGRLVLDVFNPSLKILVADNLGAEWDEGPSFDLPDGRHVVRKVKYVARDFIKQVLTIELIYDATGMSGQTERLVHAFQMRYFFRYEMEHLLARAGFHVEALYGDYEHHPLSDTHSNDLVFVAHKR
jgi:SAM-dependent methyltransferase